MGLGLRLCNYLMNICIHWNFWGIVFPKDFRIFSTHNFGLRNFTSADQLTKCMKIYLQQNYIMGTMLLLKILVGISSHAERPPLICIISVLPSKLHCMIVTIHFFCRTRPTFWYATTRKLSDSTSSASVQRRWRTPAIIYPTSTSTRYD